RPGPPPAPREPPDDGSAGDGSRWSRPSSPTSADGPRTGAVSVLSDRPAHDAAMNKTTASILILVPLLAIGLAAGLSTLPAHAGKDDQIEARELLGRGEIKPLGEILQIVQARVPGDIIEVELDRSDKRGWEYEVKVLASNGRVLEVDVNARTGQIRKIEDD